MSRVVLVAGAPGSGKTTLSRRLAGDLGWVLLAKDALKETIADAVGVSGVGESGRVGLAAVRVLYSVASQLAGRGVPVVVESAFHAGRARADLAPLLAVAAGVVVECVAPVEVCAQRYAARVAAGGRHPCHFDAERLAGGGPDFAAYGPLGLAVPTLRVDTVDGYEPGYAEVLAFVSGGVVPLTA
ncbi:ATP-binding protein [Phytomonospora sp. NPDC050363]|uniref:AAA family ATPase n=1 Tax=Phytomonospora sp. NPDC050363 TaxID=3155642 RepID=UPI0033F8F7A7